MIKVEFKNAQGDKLSARLELPPNKKAQQYAIFAHCFTCNKNLVAVRNVTRALSAGGYGILRFDFTGLGESEGDFEDTNFSSNVEDLLAAARFLKKEYQSPVLVIGHSLGGAAAIYAGAQIDSVEAITTIGAPAKPQHVQHLFDDKIDEINSLGAVQVDLGGRKFTIKKQFIDDLNKQNLASVLKEMRKALLIFHSPQDNMVGIENAAEIYKAAMHPKSFITLDGADHLLTNEQDSNYVGNMISSWAERYISMQKEKTPSSEHQVVAQLGEDKYTTKINANGHTIIADEPAKLGGNDYGPTPYDLVSAGLGACTAITLKMYVERKAWNLEEVNVHVNYQRSKPSIKNQDDPVKTDHFEKIIVLEGDLSEDQKNKLLEIAEKCPVNRTLKAGVSTSTALESK